MTRTHAPLAIAVGAACVWLAGCGGGSTPPGPTPTAPRVTAITPVTGSTLGGTVVTIAGANFTAAATVSIGGAPARDVAVAGTSAITATTSEHVAGVADVVVTVGGQRATLAGAFTYVAPPATNNQPPVITALVARGTRTNQPERFADLDEEIVVTVTATDVETAPDKLQYQWSAPDGTFTGTGASVKWRAPSIFVTPAVMPLTVTVIESYTATDGSGLPVTLQNKTTSSIDIRLHDSVKEVGDMATLFLVNFSKSEVPVDTVMQDFLPGCYGTDDERKQVTRNRLVYRITSWKVSQSPTVTVNFGGVCAHEGRAGDACSYSDVEWRSVYLPTNEPEAVAGVDQVAAMYRSSRWWLCDSQFVGERLTTTSNGFYELLRR